MKCYSAPLPLPLSSFPRSDRTRLICIKLFALSTVKRRAHMPRFGVICWHRMGNLYGFIESEWCMVFGWITLTTHNSHSSDASPQYTHKVHKWPKCPLLTLLLLKWLQKNNNTLSFTRAHNPAIHSSRATSNGKVKKETEQLVAVARHEQNRAYNVAL